LIRLKEAIGGNRLGGGCGIHLIAPRPRRFATKLKPKNMNKLPQWLSESAGVALPLAFVSIVAAAVAGITSPLFFAILLSAGLGIVVVRILFPAARLFPVAFASLIAVYAAIFSLFVEEIFRGIDPEFLVVGFCLPIFFFVVGCWLRRDQVRAVVARPVIRSERRVRSFGLCRSLSSALWLLYSLAPRGRLHTWTCCSLQPCPSLD
jgi:hypothetical protein